MKSHQRIPQRFKLNIDYQLNLIAETFDLKDQVEKYFIPRTVMKYTDKYIENVHWPFIQQLPQRH